MCGSEGALGHHQDVTLQRRIFRISRAPPEPLALRHICSSPVQRHCPFAAASSAPLTALHRHFRSCTLPASLLPATCLLLSSRQPTSTQLNTMATVPSGAHYCSECFRFSCFMSGSATAALLWLSDQGCKSTCLKLTQSAPRSQRLRDLQPLTDSDVCIACCSPARLPAPRSAAA